MSHINKLGRVAAILRCAGYSPRRVNTLSDASIARSIKNCNGDLMLAAQSLLCKLGKCYSRKDIGTRTTRVLRSIGFEFYYVRIEGKCPIASAIKTIASHQSDKEEDTSKKKANLDKMTPAKRKVEWARSLPDMITNAQFRQINRNRNQLIAYMEGYACRNGCDVRYAAKMARAMHPLHDMESLRDMKDCLIEVMLEDRKSKTKTSMDKMFPGLAEYDFIQYD